MGRTYLFECPKCAYRALVAGSAAEGARFSVQTILCYECRQLHDAVVSFKAALPPIARDSAAEGGRFSVQTILCYECRELHDAVISFKAALPRLAGDTGAATRLAGKPKLLKTAPSIAAVLNRLPLPGRTRSRWLHFKPACPVSARHRIREWNQPDKCPRCGCFLESNAIPFREWD